LATLALPLALLRHGTPAASAIAAVISVGGLTIVGTAVWWSARTLSVARRMIAQVAQEVDMQPLGARAERARALPLATDVLVAPAHPCQDAE